MTLLARQRPRCVVAEDEEILREELVGHLSQLWPELTIAGLARDGVQALAVIERTAPDVVFLDFQMPGLNGLEVAREVSGRCHVVFVTAYDSYAVAAFEQGAVDYLLKPYDRDRLALALDRVRERLAQEAPTQLGRALDEIARLTVPKRYLRWVRASVRDEIRVIPVDGISYFQADTKYTTVAGADGEAIIRTSLKALIAELDPDVFIPIHRSTIVNINAIRGVVRGLDGSMQVLLKDRPERLHVSEAHRHQFRAM